MDDPDTRPQPPDIALLYVDFPGLGDRWERSPEATAAALFRAHDRVAAIVAAHKGQPVPAWLDGRAARFATARAALDAARAIRRAELAAGELAVRVAVASGPAWEVGPVPMPLHQRARTLAEAATTDEVRLDGPTADALGHDLPEGTRLRRRWPRALPGLGKRARVVVLREAAPHGGTDPSDGHRASGRRQDRADRPLDGVEHEDTTLLCCAPPSGPGSAGDGDRRALSGANDPAVGWGTETVGGQPGHPACARGSFVPIRRPFLAFLAVLALLAAPAVVPPASAHVDGTTYRGPNYGWSIAWDPKAWRQVDEIGQNAPVDFVSFTSRVAAHTDPLEAFVAMTGTDHFAPEPGRCLDQLETSYAEDDPIYDGIERWRPEEGARFRLPETASDAAGRLFAFTADGIGAVVAYLECRPLTDDGAVLVTTFSILRSQYADTLGSFEALLAGLRVPAADRVDADADDDGLTDAFEQELGTDPDEADTDGDGVDDGEELATGTDPLVPEEATGQTTRFQGRGKTARPALPHCYSPRAKRSIV